MNYIILNGYASIGVQGLIVQELPPITKPQVRSNIETIDGRDGDIITRLGYSAYTKTFTIGLKKDANIDEVISFFSQNDSGRITFSNEPDLYYNFELLDPIDFERLIRFRQAKISIHVQPFKYSLKEGNTEFFLPSDNVIVITNSGNIYSKPVLQIRGYGEVNVSLNGAQIFTINFSTERPEVITIDSAQMEAYDDSGLRNRSVSGNYSRFKFNAGRNALKFSGSGIVSQVLIENYSRWL